MTTNSDALSERDEPSRWAALFEKCLGALPGRGLWPGGAGSIVDVLGMGRGRAARDTAPDESDIMDVRGRKNGMAGERKPMFLFRPRFLLFYLYVICYAVVRSYGEIGYRVSEYPSGGVKVREHIVAVSGSLPRWQRQTYRVIFTPLMVAEEEGRNLTAQAAEYSGSLLEDVLRSIKDLIPG